MNTERISESRSYLKEIAELYGKVLKFDSVSLTHDYSGMDAGPGCYAKEDVESVVKELSGIFLLPDETASAIKEALSTGAIDFTMLPQEDFEALMAAFPGEETPADILSLLYILSRPYFKAVGRAIDADDIYWEEGRCPVCNAAPALSVLGANETRRYCCSFCGTAGRYKRIGCPYCGNEKAETIEIMYSEKDEGVRVDACTRCHSYVKTVDASMLSGYTTEELDLISLPFDIIAQDRGFVRRAPNPVGIIRVN